MPNSGAQVMYWKLPAFGNVLVVHTMPSGEVIIPEVEPPAQAANSLSCGDQHIEFQAPDTTGVVLEVQETPSEEVIISAFEDADEDMAQKILSSGAQQISVQDLLDDGDCAVHVLVAVACRPAVILLLVPEGPVTP